MSGAATDSGDDSAGERLFVRRTGADVADGAKSKADLLLESLGISTDFADLGVGAMSPQKAQRSRRPEPAIGPLGDGLTGDALAYQAAGVGGDAALTAIELQVGMTPETFELSGYPRWTALLTAAGAPPGGRVKPRIRPTPWLLRIMEQVYDGRYEYELKAGKAAAAAAMYGKKGKPSGPPGMEELPVSAEAMVKQLKSGGAGAGAMPVDMPQFTYTFISNQLGLPRLVLQTCWDLVYNVEVHRSVYPDADVFSSFLRELYPADDLLFYLRARDVAQRLFGVQLKNKDKLTDVSAARALPPELSVALVDHPLLSKEFGVLQAFLTPMAVAVLLKELLGGDDALAGFQAQKLDESGNVYAPVHGYATPLVEVNALLRTVLKDFQSTDEEIVRALKYGDDGKGMEQLAKLQITVENAAVRKELAEELAAQERQLAALEVEHARVERRNEAAGGKQRTAVFLSAGRVSKKRHDVAIAAAELRAAEAAEEDTWNGVMESAAAARRGAGDVAKAGKTNALAKAERVRKKKPFASLDDGTRDSAYDAAGARGPESDANAEPAATVGGGGGDAGPGPAKRKKVTMAAGAGGRAGSVVGSVVGAPSRAKGRSRGGGSSRGSSTAAAGGDGVRVTKAVDAVALRFTMWTAKQLRRRRMALQTVNLMADTWKDQLENIKEQAILRIQRGWRARNARIAREAAAKAEQARIRSRKAKKAAELREHARRREEAARKAEEERRARMAAEQAAAERDMAKKKEILLAHRRESAELLHRKKLAALVKRLYGRWTLFVELRKRQRKYWRKDKQRLFTRWRAAALLFGRYRKAATRVQALMRGHMARGRVTELRRITAEHEDIARRAMARIVYAAAARCFANWVAFVRQNKRVKELMRSVLTRLEQHCFDKWYDHWLERRNGKTRVALFGQSRFRGHRARRFYRRKKHRHDAAVCVQCNVRAYYGRRFVANLRKVTREMERRIGTSLKRLMNRTKARSFDKWAAFARQSKYVKDLMRRQLDRSTRDRFDRWRWWVEDLRDARVHAATALQARFKSKRAQYAVTRLLRHSRAASVIQVSWRKNAAYRLFMAQVWRVRAAREVQRIWRGYRDRVAVAWLRLYRDSAVQIQRVWRGRQGRIAYRKAQIGHILDCATEKRYDEVKRFFDIGEGRVENDAGETILMRAAVAGSRRIVKLALRNSLDPNQRNLAGLPVLHQVVAHNPSYPEHVGVARYLVTHGANPELHDSVHGHTAMTLAAQLGKHEMVQALLDENVDAEGVNAENLSALHLAAGFNHALVVKALVEHKVDVNVPDVLGVTALHDVAAKGYVNVAKWLLYGGADIDAEDKDGWTPLGFAITSDNWDVALYLLGAGAQAMHGDEGGRTLMHYVASADKATFVPLLVEADALVDATDAEGQTALHEAATRGFLGVVKSLLEHGSNPSLQDENGDTAAHLACARGHVEVVDLLLEYDCELNVKNYDARTPLGEARFNDQQEVVDLILSKFTLEERSAEEVEAEAAMYDAHLDKKKMRLYWTHRETGEVTWIDPAAAPTKVLVRRQLIQVGEGDITVVDYRETWEETHRDIEAAKLRNRAATHMQRVFRGKKAREAVQQRKREIVARELLQRHARGFLARRRAATMRRREEAATAIQRVWRGYSQRNWVAWYTGELQREKRERWAAATINRVYRGHKVRQRFRRQRWKAEGPQTYDQWKALKAQSRLRRAFNVWEERIAPGTFDVLFYHNKFGGEIQWQQPAKWAESDATVVRQADQMRTRGYTDEMWHSAVYMQSKWRGRKVREAFSQLSKAIAIYHGSEAAYLANPRSWPNICNYMLYLHCCDAHDYDRARPLYIKAMEYMEHRGPDNPFILYAFSIFLAATQEEDFSTIMMLLQRAKVSDTHRKAFRLAELGFFRQALVESPNNPHTCVNYALMRAFLHADYDEAERYFLKALVADPKDVRIVDCFNYVLEEMAGRDYSGYDAFRKLQEKDAMEADKKLAEEWHVKQWYMAQKLQAVYRGHRTRKVMHFVRSTVKTEAREYEACDDGEGGVYFYHTATGESVWELPTVAARVAELRKFGVFQGGMGVLPGAPASDLALKMSDPAMDEGDDPDQWEVCDDGQGNEYYYSAATGESSWEQPKLPRLRAIQLIYGMRGFQGGTRVEDMLEDAGDDDKPLMLEGPGARSHRLSIARSAAGASGVESGSMSRSRSRASSLASSEVSGVPSGYRIDSAGGAGAGAGAGAGGASGRSRRDSLASSAASSAIGVDEYGVSVHQDIAADLDNDAAAMFGLGPADGDGGGVGGAGESKGTDEAGEYVDPALWEEVDDGEGGVYYYHTGTGHSAWDKPAGYDARKVAEVVALDDATEPAAIEDAKPATSADGSPAVALPPLDLSVATERRDMVASEATEEAIVAAEEAATGQVVVPAEDGEWEEVSDPDTGHTYFYNTKTGESTWEMPSALAKLRAIVRLQSGVSLAAAAEGSEGEGGAGDTDWEEVHDPDTDHTYFYNARTGESTWEMPAALAKLRALVRLGAAARAGAGADADADAGAEPLETDRAWEEAEDDDGNRYYYNNKTGTSTWDRPDAFKKLRSMLALGNAFHGGGGGGDGDGDGGDGAGDASIDADSALVAVDNPDSAVVPTDPDAAPEDKWESAEDDDGRTYWYNAATGHSTYRDPDNPDNTAVVVAAAPEVEGAPGWREFVDDDTGHTYFFNSETNETSWERPGLKAKMLALGAMGHVHGDGRDDDEDAAEAEAEAADEAAAAALLAAAADEAGEWERVEGEDGSPDYFVNSATGETAWELPSDAE